MVKLLRQPIVRFLLISSLSYCAWLILYYFVIKEETNWDYYLDYNLASISNELFNFFGSQTTIDVESDMVVLILQDANGIGMVWIGDQCNGFKLFSIFAIFILAFPGSWKAKLWFIPLGIIIIHAANIVRVISLLQIDFYYPTFLDFNHLYTFTIFVYSIIFVLWLWWAKKFGNVNKD